MTPGASTGMTLVRSPARPPSASQQGAPVPTAHSAITCSSYCAAVTPTSRARTRSATGRPRCGVPGPPGSPSRRGGCSSTSASHSGTSLGSRKAPSTSPPNGPRATGPSRTRRPMRPPGRRAWAKWSGTSARWSASWPTPRPTCSPASRTAPAKPCCVRHWCWPTTTSTIWASWCCCDACSERGRKTRLRSPRRRALYVQAHLLEERASPRLQGEAALDPRQDQPLARPRHADIQKTPGLLDLGLAVLGGLAVAGDLVVLDSDDVHPRELQALGRMQREEVDAIGHDLDPLRRREGHPLEQSIDAVGERGGGVGVDQRPQPGDRGRISL